MMMMFINILVLITKNVYFGQMENEGLAFYHSTVYKVCILSHNVPTVKQKSVLISYVIAEISARINDDNLLLEENSFKQNTSNEITILKFK